MPEPRKLRQIPNNPFTVEIPKGFVLIYYKGAEILRWDLDGIGNDPYTSDMMAQTLHMAYTNPDQLIEWLKDRDLFPPCSPAKPEG